MKKLNLTIAALALLAMSGCSITNIEKNSLKEPNGNIKVNELVIQGVVPVDYTYNTTDQECSEIEFLKSMTGRRISGVRVDNIYEIHWNHVENHNKVLGISGPKMYTCNFWGLGIQYNVGAASSAPTAQAPVQAPVQAQAAPIQRRSDYPTQAQPTAFRPTVAPQSTAPAPAQAPARQAAPAPVSVDDSWD